MNSLEVLKCTEKLPADRELKSFLFPGELFHHAADRPCFREHNVGRVPDGFLRFFVVAPVHCTLSSLLPRRARMLSECFYLFGVIGDALRVLLSACDQIR